MNPEVSVVMPVWDRERYLKTAVESILLQTYTDFELILIDDGCGPKMRSILETFARSDHRIRLYHLPCNLGVSAAKNVGIKMARGRYLAWMDSDDDAMPDRLAEQVRFLEANPDVTLCGTDAVKHLEDGRQGRMHLPEKDGAIKSTLWLVNGGAILTPTAMMRTAFIHDNGLYHSSQFPRDLDHVHYIDMMKAGARFYCIQKPLLKYRRHGGNVTSNRTGMDQEKSAVRMLLIPELFPELSGAEGKALLELMKTDIQVSYVAACQGISAAHKASQERRVFYGEDRDVLNRILSGIVQRVRQGMLGPAPGTGRLK